MYCENKNHNTLCVRNLSPNRVKLRKKTIIIELVWVIGLLLIAFFISGLIISNTAIDISAQDTYRADGSRWSPKFPLFFLLFISAGFVVYAVKASLSRFRIGRIIFVFTVFNCLLLFYLECLYQSNVYFFVSAFADRANNARPVKGLFYGADPLVFYAIRVLPWLKIFLTLTLVFTAFMVGKLYEMNRRNAANI